MLKSIGLAPFVLVVAGLSGVGLVDAVTTGAGQTPAPSLPATYLSNAELMTALKKATDSNPDMSTAAD